MFERPQRLALWMDRCIAFACKELRDIDPDAGVVCVDHGPMVVSHDTTLLSGNHNAMKV